MALHAAAAERAAETIANDNEIIIEMALELDDDALPPLPLRSAQADKACAHTPAISDAQRELLSFSEAHNHSKRELWKIEGLTEKFFAQKVSNFGVTFAGAA